MGVCPQFDILWDQLTGREHMLIYGTIKVCSCITFYILQVHQQSSWRCFRECLGSLEAMRVS